MWVLPTITAPASFSCVTEALSDGATQFVRTFESELDTYRIERGDPAVDSVTRLASLVAAEAGVEVLVADTSDWSLIDRIKVHGQPIFVMSRPDEQQVWVTFAHPDNDRVQVIDTRTHEVIETLSPGESILHKEFTPRGEHIWISARDSDHVVVYDTRTFEELARLPAESPSGIFFTHRAHRIGL